MNFSVNLNEWKLRYFPRPDALIDQSKMFHDRKDIFKVSAECDDGQVKLLC